MTPDTSRDKTVAWPDLLAVFGRIGLLSFGGPAGQIALMHKELVEERGWLDEPRFLHALNFCMLLPGPEAMQLATYSGWLLRGVRGGLAAGLLFVVPGFLVILSLSAAYLFLGDLPGADGVLLGLKAAVLAIVVQALLRMAGRTLRTPLAWGLALLAFAGIALLKLPFPLIVLGAGAIGVVSVLARGDAATEPGVSRPDWRIGGTIVTVALWGAVWLVPLGLIHIAAPGVYAEMAAFFSRAAVVTFGGAYAVLAYVGQQAVAVHGWLAPGDMLAGLGLAETTPGPLILVLVFVGFLGGARQSGLDPLTGGLLGGSVALFFTFAPCFLWIFAGAPHIERLRQVRWLSGGLSAITAAIVGVIANLALWFGLNVLFVTVGRVRIGPLDLPLPDPAGIQWAALAIAIVAALALTRYSANLFVVLAGAIAAGLAAAAAGFVQA